MRIEFDPAKNRANFATHGVDLVLAGDFEFDTAVFSVDARKDYGETRNIAIGYISDRLHLLILTKRRTVKNRKKPNHIAQKDWDDADSPPLTDKELEVMKPLRDGFPALASMLRSAGAGQRGLHKGPRKVPISVRVDPDVFMEIDAEEP